MGQLKDYLNLAIENLEADAVKYDWSKYKHCNCGVVARCALSDSEIPFKDMVERPFKDYSDDGSGYNVNWKQVAREYCTVTGLSNYRIFQELRKRGINHTDITQLEFLSDPKILELSDIPRIPITRKVEKGEETRNVSETYYEYVKRTVVVDEVIKLPSLTFWGKLFGLSIKEKIKVAKEIDEKIEKTRMVDKVFKIYEEEIIGYKYEDNYFKKRSNLIHYLKAWVKLIENQEKEQNIEEGKIKTNES